MNTKRLMILALAVVVVLICSMMDIFTAKTAQAEEKEENALFTRLTIAPIAEGKMDDLIKIPGQH